MVNRSLLIVLLLVITLSGQSISPFSFLWGDSAGTASPDTLEPEPSEPLLDYDPADHIWLATAGVTYSTGDTAISWADTSGIVDIPAFDGIRVGVVVTEGGKTMVRGFPDINGLPTDFRGTVSPKPYSTGKRISTIAVFRVTSSDLTASDIYINNPNWDDATNAQRNRQFTDAGVPEWLVGLSVSNVSSGHGFVSGEWNFMGYFLPSQYSGSTLNFSGELFFNKSKSTTGAPANATDVVPFEETARLLSYATAFPADSYVDLLEARVYTQDGFAAANYWRTMRYLDSLYSLGKDLPNYGYQISADEIEADIVFEPALSTYPSGKSDNTSVSSTYETLEMEAGVRKFGLGGAWFNETEELGSWSYDESNEMTINASDSASVDGWTFICVVKSDVINGTQNFIANTTNVNNYVILGSNSDTLRVYDGSAWNNVSNDSLLTTGRWRVITFRVDNGDSLSTFIDDSYISSVDFTGGLADVGNGNMTFFQTSAGTQDHRLKELRLYHEVLTNEQIVKLADLLKTKHGF